MISYSELLKTVNEQEAMAADFSPVVLRFLRNYTIEKIEPFLKHILYAVGLKPILYFGGYNTVQQEIWQEVASEKNEILVLTLLLDQLDADYNHPHWDSMRVRSYLQELLTSLSAKTNATVIVNTFFLPSALKSKSKPLDGSFCLLVNGRFNFIRLYTNRCLASSMVCHLL